MNPPDVVTQTDVQDQIDRHQRQCTRMLDTRISELVQASSSLLGVSTAMTANIAKLDERTHLHGEQIDRVEERQQAGNRYAIATMIGICITFLTLIIGFAMNK
jgi:hypothetical protein